MKKIISCMLLGLLTGCANFNSDLALEKTPVKIGVITPLSGGLAAWGEETERILNQAIIDNFGSEANIELVYGDSKCNGVDSVTAYQKLVNVDRVDVILGGLCSTESLAFAPLLENDGMVALSAVSNHPDLDGMSTNFLTVAFRIDAHAAYLADEVADSDKIAIISEQNDWNMAILDTLENDLADKIVSSQVFEKGENDFRNMISKALRINPEVLILNPNAGPASENLLRQLAEEDLEGVRLVSQLPTYLSEDMRSIAPDLLKNMSVVDTATIQDQAFKDFKLSLGEIKHFTDYRLAGTHDALLNLVLAHRRSVANETDVLSELRNNPLQGFVTSGSQFNKDTFLGGVEFSTFVLEDGKIKEV